MPARERILLLARHAQADTPPGCADVDRPLTERGVAQARALGRWLAHCGPAVDRISHSPALRTRRTAQLVAAQVGLAPEELWPEPVVYAGWMQELLALVRGTDDEVSVHLLVGHAPGLPALAAHLGGVPDAGLPPAGLVVLRDCPPWAELDAATCRAEVVLDAAT